MATFHARKFRSRMEPHIVTSAQFKYNPSKLILEAAESQSIAILTRHGKSVAAVIPLIIPDGLLAKDPGKYTLIKIDLPDISLMLAVRYALENHQTFNQYMAAAIQEYIDLKKGTGSQKCQGRIG